ncbi:MAG TPA: TlpA disulfide reductase family protein, partial [Fimbriimonadaceae bacterium]|nr:TlpA disulfide reductase family protein [Fimbriimonadaceae bacterium]
TSAQAIGGPSGADVLKSLDDFRADLVTKAIDKAKSNGSEVDAEDIQKQVKAKAEDAVKSIDVSKVAVADGLDWAQVFEIADRPREAATLLTAFIGSKPEAPKLFEAQEMLVSASWRIKDDKSVVATLQAMKPFDGGSSVKLAELVVTYVPHESGVLGLDPAAAMIDGALAGVPAADLTERQKDRLAELQSAGVEAKIALYRDAGKTDKALAAIDGALKSAGPGLKDRLTMERNRLTLVGMAAPDLKVEKSCGEFKSLADFKGKVVVLDFFAHWCDPCKSEFADLRKLLDDFKSKGLEVVGVTHYYGFFGDPDKPLTDEQEYAKMADFIKDEKIDWPIVIGPEDDFSTFGVAAIPQIVLIGRDGIVKSLEVGYSAGEFAQFRQKVEDLLAGKSR